MLTDIARYARLVEFRLYRVVFILRFWLCLVLQLPEKAIEDRYRFSNARIFDGYVPVAMMVAHVSGKRLARHVQD